jgi:ABC-type uncharacterized transport system substrate-binding protein
MTRGRVGAVLASKHRLPAIFPFRAWVEVGGLMSYGPDYPDLMRRVATYVDRILKGAKPADLPVEQPTKFELILNVRTAKTIGLTITSPLSTPACPERPVERRVPLLWPCPIGGRIHEGRPVGHLRHG